MIQDILPKQLYNQYAEYQPREEDTVFIFQGSTTLAKQEGDTFVFPTYGQIKEHIQGAGRNALLHEDAKIYDMTGIQYKCIYLFAIDDQRFFLGQKVEKRPDVGSFKGDESDDQIHDEQVSFLDGYAFAGVNSFRRITPQHMAFAVITAYHLYGWYRDNMFCGRCGRPMEHDGHQRMMRCYECGNMVFPKICPVVIVAITDGDRIVMTKYAGGNYRNYALVAGFGEIGETIEETVHREVMEEVGLKVKNLKYYKSQPWGLSGSLLFGFFCELDGDDTIKLQEEELSVGEWMHASEMDEIQPDGVSLTREMMLKFKEEHQK